MAEREPIVIVSGQLRQLPSGDTLNIGYTPGADLSFVASNVTGSTINILSAVYVDAADTINLAKADAAATSKFAGFMEAETTNNTSGNVVFGGVVTGNTAQWDAVAGTTGGLAANTLYYLSDADAGKITATAPTTAASYVKPVGLALSTTNLLILQQQSILL